MKTFYDLISEVQEQGLCHRCGGCATFCTAVNYGALELDERGKPRFKYSEKCIECGLCYTICPEIDELDEETKKIVSWVPPMGRVIETTFARAHDPKIRAKATDGGAVTALLLHLFDSGRIDGAIVTKPTGLLKREPFLAMSRKDIMDSTGFFFDTSQGMKQYGDKYLTFSTIEQFEPIIKRNLRRVAMVGTPCQIRSVRKMQTLSVLPSDAIKYCLGLFCSGNFAFGEKQQKKLAKIGGFKWDDVKRINIKEDLLIHFNSGGTKAIPLDELEFMKRFACYFCPDYGAEFADISFGGLGSKNGWTTVITRTPVGRAVFADAKSGALDIYADKNNSAMKKEALNKIRVWFNKKKKTANINRGVLRDKINKD
jgi:coenzyme F420 hydrogenase subunit beta